VGPVHHQVGPLELPRHVEESPELRADGERASSTPAAGSRSALRQCSCSRRTYRRSPPAAPCCPAQCIAIPCRPDRRSYPIPGAARLHETRRAGPARTTHTAGTSSHPRSSRVFPSRLIDFRISSSSGSLLGFGGKKRRAPALPSRLRRGSRAWRSYRVSAADELTTLPPKCRRRTIATRVYVVPIFEPDQWECTMTYTMQSTGTRRTTIKTHRR
jgi:hypothetical protein